MRIEPINTAIPEMLSKTAIPFFILCSFISANSNGKGIPIIIAGIKTRRDKYNSETLAFKLGNRINAPITRIKIIPTVLKPITLSNRDCKKY